MIYLSGKITDVSKEKELLNMEIFNKVERELKAQGYEVFNPVIYEIDGGTWEYYLARDLQWIATNKPDIYVLPNWRESKGARLEVEFAYLLGLKILNK